MSDFLETLISEHRSNNCLYSYLFWWSSAVYINVLLGNYVIDDNNAVFWFILLCVIKCPRQTSLLSSDDHLALNAFVSEQELQISTIL